MPYFYRVLFIAFFSMAIGGTYADSKKDAKVHVLYEDGLKNGWQNWSWAKHVKLEYPLPKVKPIEVSGGAWEALQLHHDSFSTKGYSKLTFFINGGLKGGQKLLVKLSKDGKLIETHSYEMELKAKSWQYAEVPLESLDAIDKVIDGVVIQGKEKAFDTFYITSIQFE